MASIDLLPSEVVLLEQALNHKARKLKLARRITQKAEDGVDEALNSIFERADIEEIHGRPRLLRGLDGRPAQLVWADPKAVAHEVTNEIHTEEPAPRTQSS